MDRRLFLQAVAGYSLLAASGESLAKDDPVLFEKLENELKLPRWLDLKMEFKLTQDRLNVVHEERSLYLARESTGELERFTYWKNGQIDPIGYAVACRLLRDVKAEEETNINVILLDSMWKIQSDLVDDGIEDPLVILSGYRTKKTNSRTEGASKDSEHMKGNAGDLILPRIGPRGLLKIAEKHVPGGIGFYPRKKFVHIDTGKKRHWTVGGFGRRLKSIIRRNKKKKRKK